MADNKKQNRLGIISRHKILLTLIVFFACVLFLGGLTIFNFVNPKHDLKNSWNYESIQKELLTQSDNITTSKEGQNLQTDSQFPITDKNFKSLTVLLVGLDQRPEDPSIGNTDTLILAQVDGVTGQVGFLSIPRDTQVKIPNYGIGKINMAARVGGGLNSTVKVLENLLQQPVDGYVATNFSAFKDIIDTLGGVDIDVEKNMFYKTGDKIDGVINLKKGIQHLNGQQALQYARFRQDSLADIGRTVRQQKLLKAVADEFIQLSTLPKLPALIPQIYNAVETDLPLNKLWSLAGASVKINQGKIISQTLPGNFVTENGISYWKIDSQECRRVASEFFSHGKTYKLFSTVVKGEAISAKNNSAAQNNGEKREKINSKTVVSNIQNDLNNSGEAKNNSNDADGSQIEIEIYQTSNETKDLNEAKNSDEKNKENVKNAVNADGDIIKEIEDSIIFETETLP